MCSLVDCGLYVICTCCSVLVHDTCYRKGPPVPEKRVHSREYTNPTYMDHRDVVSPQKTAPKGHNRASPAGQNRTNPVGQNRASPAGPNRASLVGQGEKREPQRSMDSTASNRDLMSQDSGYPNSLERHR